MNAISEWIKVLGKENVMLDCDDIQAAEACTFETGRYINTVIRPANASEVVFCVVVANKLDHPIYPLSCGKNWGYGSMIPPSNGSVMLLSRMNQIMELNQELGLVRIQPGVTFAKLKEALEGTEYLAPTIGSTPDASVMGNCLDRGIGQFLYEDMESHIEEITVVLPNGNVETISKNQSGPNLIGIFIQSAVGVVVEMTFRLEKKPKLSHRFGTKVSNLSEAIVKYRELLSRNPNVQVQIISDYQLASCLEHSPNPSGLTPKEWINQKLGDECDWYATGTTWAENEEELAYITARVQRISQCSWDKVEQNWNPRSIYWKMGSIPENPDPNRDSVGLIWVSVSIPLDDKGLDIITYSKKTLMDHNFDPFISLRISKDGAKMVIGIIYDRSIEGEDSRADECRAELNDFFYISGVNVCRATLLDDIHNSPIEIALKNALDPKSIILGRHLAGNQKPQLTALEVAHA